MINTKKNVMSKDYGCLLIAILSNKSLYPLIDEEYENNKREYDELILNSDFFNNNRHKIISEDMKEYSIKLTGIFLSKNGNNFMRKILKSGWPRLYDYVENTDCVVYEEIKQIKDYGLDNLSEGYTIYIIKQMLDMFNKDMTHKRDESKREIDAYNNRLSLAWNIMIKEKFFQSLDKEFQLVSGEVNRDNTLQKRINLDKNSNFCKGLLYLMSYYSIDLWDFGQSYKIEEKDRELLASYLDASVLSIDDILNNVDESRYVNEEQITNDALTGTRGVIIGGTPQWQQHMRKIVPHFKFIEVEQLNYDTKILENADKIYFNTAYNSHAMFYKTINAVRKNKIEIVFINNNSITAGFKMFGQKNGQYKGEHLVS